MGQTIQLETADGQPFDVYTAGPQDATGAVMILHEWWGVMPHNRDWADRLADLGYRAIVVDLYDGRVTDEMEVASGWMREIDQTLADEKLKAALDYLETPGRTIVTYGCSFGGKESMQATLLAPDKVAATILAYCRMETDVEKLKTLQGPVLAIYAQQERNWPQKQEDFEVAMAFAGKDTQGVGYDAAHGFTNPTSPRYDAEADKAAWETIVRFLQLHLGGS
ncbi:MAG: dienelactone hydrolase family protein [Gammaproteobacteria bacterium]|nr:dienelactone hydrolase family protein [Gammaproteobacteria bacterium]